MPKLQHFLILLVVALFSVSSFYLFQPGEVSSGRIESYVRIGSGNRSDTKTRDVTLYLLGPEDVKEMIISDDSDFSDDNWEDYKTQKEWTLGYGRGRKKVYVKFKDSEGDVSSVHSDSVFLAIPKDMNVDFVINNDDEETNQRYVNLKVDYSEGVESVQISNREDFTDSRWRGIRSNYSWVLSSEGGEKTVYMKFRDGNNETKIISDSINYNPPKRDIKEGSLVAGPDTALYYYGYDGYLHPFSSNATYHSWYNNFEDIQRASSKKLSSFVVGKPVCVRGGTWLVKFESFSQVYAVEPGCELKPIHSQVEASVLYGQNWSDRILELPDYHEGFYEVKDDWRVDKSKTDKDKDGVPDSIEDDYESSNDSVDTDGDMLTDYEEIYFWFTDPTKADTDGDGVSDGEEIINRTSPLDGGELKEIPDNTYSYPLGSLVRTNSGDVYHKFNIDQFYFAGDSVEDHIFQSNNFQERFIISTELKAESIESDGQLYSPNENLIKPNRRNNSGELEKL